jgi:hypothetical protein
LTIDLKSSAYWFVSVGIGFLILQSCGSRDGSPRAKIPLPYPDNKMAQFYQERVDSSEFEWMKDVKGAASSFMNEYGFKKDGVSTTDIRILGEGIYHAQVEVELPDEIVVLTMERPFKHKGRDSIWQVVAMEEKKWPQKE